MWKERYRLRKRQGLKRSKKVAFYTKTLFILSLIGLLALFIILPIFAYSLPSPEKVVRREGFATKILDRNEKPLYDIYEDERRSPVSLEEIPQNLKEATIAIEDKNFYKHGGFDLLGISRGLLRCFVGRCQGGSTLTQQLVKNVLLSSERSVFRKIREFMLSIQIERKYSKDEILRMYLNEAPYGGTLWGVESASETYFGKKVKDINLVEAVILAGIPQRPGVYSPYSSNPKAYIDRSKNVIRRMEEDGYITKEEEANTLEELETYQFQEKGSTFKAPHFVSYVSGLLKETYGEDVVEQGGLIVTTTLDLDLQEKAQAIVADEIAKVEKVHITNGAAMVIDPQTGEILSMVGSKNFNATDYDGQVNVTLSLRQPGSSFKPITYVTALKKGYTPSTLLMDVPTEFPGGDGKPPYIPVNYDGKYRGPIQLRYALGNSINVPAVKLLALVGIKDVLTTAYEMGLTTLPPTKETLSRVGLSLTLGGGEVRLIDLTGAYCTFVNEGYKVEPVAILKVVDKNGKTLEKNEPKKGKSVITKEQAYIMANILSDNEARKEIFGTNSLLNIPGKMIAVKTGTTNDKRDNWTLGGNSQVMVGVWVGNNDNTQMKEVASGVSGASPIWRKILLEALSGKPTSPFNSPENIVSAQVDSVSGFRAHDGFPERLEYFIRGTEPGEDPVHVKMKVCKNDGKIAAPSDISSGNYDEKEYFIFKEEDPTSAKGGPNKWQEGILNWLNGQTDSKYHPPTEYCGATNPLSVDFNEPGDRSSNLGGEFKVRLRADSTSKIIEVELLVNNNKIRGFSEAPYEHTLNLGKGVYELKVKAKDEGGHEAERTIKVGVGVAWDYTEPTPSPSPVATTPTI